MSIEAAFARVAVGGGSFHACTEQQVVTAVRRALDQGAGGRIITPNVDILRQAQRDAAVRALLAEANFVVADGMPLIWASRLAGTPLPERVCGSSLVWSLARGLARDGRSVYVLGGEPADPAPLVQRAGPDAGASTAPGAAGRRQTAAGVDAHASEGARVAGAPAQRIPASVELRSAYAAGRADAATPLDAGPSAYADGLFPTRVGGALGAHRGPAVPDGAWRAAERLLAANPGLRIAGWRSPAFGFDQDTAAFADICRGVVETKPDLVYVGIGFPRQEWVISRLRAELPFTWFLGCGAAINFVAGDQLRAPRWMQRSGLEWAHRLATEPRRLAGRYVRHDAPYAVRLLAGAFAARYRARRATP